MYKAIYVKTESSDNYLYCVPEETDTVAYVKEQMKEESEHICDLEVAYSLAGKGEVVDIADFWKENN